MRNYIRPAEYLMWGAVISLAILTWVLEHRRLKAMLRLDEQILKEERAKPYIILKRIDGVYRCTELEKL